MKLQACGCHVGEFRLEVWSQCVEKDNTWSVVAPTKAVICESKESVVVVVSRIGVAAFFYHKVAL